MAVTVWQWGAMKILKLPGPEPMSIRVQLGMDWTVLSRRVRVLSGDCQRAWTRSKNFCAFSRQ